MSLPRFGGKRWCWNKELRMDQTDAAVWREVCQLLEEPERLGQEYRQRLQPQQKPEEQEGLDAQMGKLRRGLARLIDSYAEGLIEKQEFEPRVTRMRERLQHLEEQLQHLKEEAEGEEELRLVLGRLESFAAKVKDGLHEADFQTRREIIRALVKRVEIDEQHIRVVFRLSPLSPALASDSASPNLQHWGRRVHARSLEGDMGTSLFREPIGELQQLFRRGQIGPEFFVRLAIGTLCQQAGLDGLLVHVSSSAVGVEDLHRNTPVLLFEKML